MSEGEKKKHPFAFQGLTRVIHEKARLGILTALFSSPGGYGFNELKNLCNLSDGNLSRHLKVLTEYGYVETEKSFKENKPYTHCWITAVGKGDFLDYLETLEEILRSNAASSAVLPRGGLADIT